MHPRAHTVVVVAVVAVVAAAPAAGIVPAPADAGGQAPTDGVDRPAVEDWSDGASTESSDWLPFELDDEDEDEDEDDEDREREEGDGEEGEGDEGGEDRDAGGDDERESDTEDDSGDRGWDWDDEEEDGEDDDRWWDWWSDDEDDDRERGDAGDGDRGAGRGNGNANPGHGNSDDNPGHGNSDDNPGHGNSDDNPGHGDRGGDERRAGNGGSDGGDDRDAADGSETPDEDQQSGGASDDGRSESGQSNDRDETDDSPADRSVRVDAQEDDAGQEGSDGQEGDGERNETRNDGAEPGPDVGSATVTVLRTPEVVGQPLVVEATTTNEGTEAGRKVVQFEVEHEVLDNRSFVLQPGETRTVTFRHVFETPGNKTFEVDTGKNRFVTVEERRPNLSVSTVAVSPRSVEAGGDVTITANVSNAGYANGTMPVALELFGEVVGVKNVTLATGESTNVSFTRSVHAPGSYEAVVENETAAFRVVESRENQTTATGNESVLKSAAETPGFGAAVAVLAGVVAALALALGGRE